MMNQCIKQAMIFAAGKGTRLKPITDSMPKALVPVAGEPLLKHVIFKLRDAGFERIVINVHHFADQIVDYLKDNNNFNMDIRISDEREQLLETGGGVKHAKDLFDLNSPILIHNVDILSNIDVNLLWEKAIETQADAVLIVSERMTKRYLLFDDANRLVGWTNIETKEVKSPYTDIEDRAKTKYAFSGVHVIRPSLLKLMEDEPDRFPIMDFYLKNCNQAKILGQVKNDLRLMDVGKQDTLAQADTFIHTL